MSFAPGAAPPGAPSPSPADGARRAPSPARAQILMAGALAVDAALLAIGVGGPVALSHHPRALALLALWVVCYPWLTVKRPPAAAREEARPDPLIVLTLTIVPTVAPLVSALAERNGLWRLPGGDALRWGGVAIAAGGFALRIAAMRRLGSRFAPIVAIERDHRLETGGVYARLRHPGYLGAWLATFGTVLAFGSAATLPLVAIVAGAQVARIRAEEAALEGRFGEEYRRYRARTGSVLPKLF